MRGPARFLALLVFPVLTGWVAAQPSLLNNPVVRPVQPNPQAPVWMERVPDEPGSGRASMTQSVEDTYILRENEIIEIGVFQEPDLLTTTRISLKGTITLPLIGEIKVGGRMVRDVVAEIERRYRDGYLRNPKVSILMVEFAKKRFHVLGQVNRPGSFEIPQQESVNLLQAIAMAGGYTRIANPGRVTVRRRVGDKDEVFNLNAASMAKDGGSKIFEIRHNDTITVTESLF
jgi:polysaccharide export outer membrane protein